MCYITNIYNMFLAQWWRLETGSRLFYDFIKMTILRDLALFNSWNLPYLNVSNTPFQNIERLES